MAGYKATRGVDETLVVHDVPIFCTCERDDIVFGEEWVAAAVKKAMERQSGNYFPPLHIRHHSANDDDVRAAGFFKITGTAPITLDGKRRSAILADLVITDPTVQEEILSLQLPYRSVEIFNVEEPSIDSLALLDHEAPFLELPMLMVSEVNGSITNTTAGVASATFGHAWSLHSVRGEAPVVACFRRGATAHLLFKNDEESQPMAQIKPAEPDVSVTVTTGPASEQQGVLFADKKDDDDDGEELESAALDVGAVVKAISDGSISVADMDAILAAIQNQKTEVEEEEEPEAAPAAAPGGEAMSSMDEKMAALQGKIDGLEAAAAEREAQEQQRENVAIAMQRLENRPLGADLEEKLVAFHHAHGAAAFAAYVDSLVAHVGIPTQNGAGAAFHSTQSRTPEVAMKYQDKGIEAVEAASGFATEWGILNSRGTTTLTEERYVELNMARKFGG